MNVLLDTVTFLWIGEGSPRLSALARSIVLEPTNRLLLSAVSAWEINVKVSIGKLPLPADPATYIRRTRAARDIVTIEFSEDDAAQISALPSHHRDPFDRALVSQAITRSLAILTPDPAFRQYPIATLW